MLGAYTLGDEIGSGASAKVYAATTPDGAQFAIKLFKHDKKNEIRRQMEMLAAEREVARQMNHPNVVVYYEIVLDAT